MSPLLQIILSGKAVDWSMVKIICDGNSITNGSIGGEASYPTQMAALAPFAAAGTEIVNLGVDGSTMLGMISRSAAAIAANVDPDKINILLAMEELNGIYAERGTKTAQEHIDDANYYIGLWKTAGCIIGYGVMYGTTYAGDTDFNQTVADFKALQLGGALDADFLIRYDLSPELSNPASSIYFLDGVHLKGAGKAVLAEDAKAAILANRGLLI